MKSRPQCTNNGAGAEDYALNPSLLFRQIGREYKVNALVIMIDLSSSLIAVVLGGPKSSYGGLRPPPMKTRNCGPRRGRMKENLVKRGPANLMVLKR